MRWADEDTECLITLRNNNWQVKDIAEEMGFSKSTIEYRIRKLDLFVNKKWTAEEDAKLIELTSSGAWIKECSIILGRSEDTIKSRKVKLKVTNQKNIRSIPYIKPIKTIREKDSYKYSQKPDKLTKLYLIEFDGFYKIGTTQQSMNQRFGGRYPSYEVVLILEMALEEALRMESAWLNNVKDYKYVPDCFPKEGRGYTECFKFE